MTHSTSASTSEPALPAHAESGPSAGPSQPPAAAAASKASKVERVTQVDLDQFAENPDEEECWDDAFEEGDEGGFDDDFDAAFDDLQAAEPDGGDGAEAAVSSVEADSFDDAFEALSGFAEESEQDAKKRIEFNHRLVLLQAFLDGIRKLTNPKLLPTAQMIATATGDKSVKKMKRSDYMAAVTSQLIAMFERHPEMLTQTVKENALVPIVSLLSLADLDIRFHVLYLLREIAQKETILIPLCMMGAIPVVAECGSRKYPPEHRVLAAHILQIVATTDKQSLQMYSACGGIAILIDFLHSEDFETDHGVIEVTLQTIKDFLLSSAQALISRVAFLDVFVTHGIFPKLAAILAYICESRDVESSLTFLLIDVLQIFIKGGHCTPFALAIVACANLLPILLRLLDLSQQASDELKVTPSAVKITEFFRDLSQTTNEGIFEGSVAVISGLLQYILPFCHEHRLEPTVYNPILHCLYNFCKANAHRQRIFAESGGIDLIKEVVPRRLYGPRGFALSLLFEMASGTGLTASRGGDAKLKIYNSLHEHLLESMLFYLLSEGSSDLEAIHAISRWTLAQPANLTPYLTAPANIKLIVKVFSPSNIVNGTVSSLKLLVEAVSNIIHACPDFKASLANESSDFIPTTVRMFQVRKDKLPLLRLYSVFLVTEPTYPLILDQANLRNVLREASVRTSASPGSDLSLVRAMLDNLMPIIG